VRARGYLVSTIEENFGIMETGIINLSKLQHSFLVLSSDLMVVSTIRATGTRNLIAAEMANMAKVTF